MSSTVYSLFILSFTQIAYTVCLLSVELELIFLAADIIVCLILFFFVWCAFISFSTNTIKNHAHTRQFINHESNFQFISHAPFSCLAESNDIFQLPSANFFIKLPCNQIYLCVFSLSFYVSHRD